MNRLTMNDLSAFVELSQEIRHLQDQLDNIYAASIKSPKLEKIGSQSNSVGNPTESAVFQKMRIEGQIQKKTQRLADLLVEIETKLEQIDDQKVKRIIRLHYLLNYSWRQTSLAVYGYSESQAAKYKLQRFFKKEEKDAEIYSNGNC